jgi:hypothetical protein
LLVFFLVPVLCGEEEDDDEEGKKEAGNGTPWDN